MNSFQGADYAGSLSKGIASGMAIGGAIKQGIAEAGYSNARNEAIKTRDEAIKAAGNDQKAIDLARQNYSTAMDNAYETYGVKSGNVQAAHAARIKSEQRDFRNNFFGELQKNPAAYDQKIVDDLNTDTVTKVNGMHYSLGDKPGLLLMTMKDGQTQSIPFTNEQRMPYVNNLYDMEFKNKFGTDPTEPTSEASSGAQATTAQDQAIPSSNPRVAQVDPLVAEAAASDPRTQAIPQKGAPSAGGEKKGTLDHMEEQERQLYDYSLAYYRRFGELPPGVDASRLLAVAKQQETNRSNRATEAINMQKSKESERHNRAEEGLYAERTEMYRGRGSGGGSDSKTAEKFTLDEPDAEQSRRVIGRNGLPTGTKHMVLETNNGSPTVYAPDGMPKKEVSSAYDFATGKYGNPVNIGNRTLWYAGMENGNRKYLTFEDIVDEQNKANQAAVQARAAAKKAKREADKKRLAKHREAFQKYEKGRGGLTTSPAQKENKNQRKGD